MTPLILLVAALGSALLGGVFFAFSSFVMPALARLPRAEGIRAMQRINIDVFHWSFMLVFFATPLLCVVLAVGTLLHGASPYAGLAIAGAALHVVGCFGVTAAGNVPLNNKLAQIEAASDGEALGVWASYLVRWTRYNHLRTAACMAAAVLLVLAFAAA